MGEESGAKQKRYCAACFSEVGERDSACQSCGHGLINSPGSSFSESSPIPYSPLGAPKRKNPLIAALVGLAGFVLLLSPSTGYFYLGKFRKGAIYLFLTWVALAVVILFLASSMFNWMGFAETFGKIVATPDRAMLLLLAFGFALFGFNAIMLVDVYLDAKGDVTYLPEL